MVPRALPPDLARPGLDGVAPDQDFHTQHPFLLRVARTLASGSGAVKSGASSPGRCRYLPRTRFTPQGGLGRAMTKFEGSNRRGIQRRRKDRRAEARAEERLLWLLWLIGVLNFTDAAQTVYLLNARFMVEANRLMAFLLDHSPYVFWMYKTLVPTLGCVLLWRYRRRVRWIHGAVVTVFAVYVTVVMRSLLYMLLPQHL